MNRTMQLEKMEFDMTICKVTDEKVLPLNSDFCFVGKTDEEISLVCRTVDAPKMTIARDDGWRGFRIKGTLDFSLTGILAKLSAILAEKQIGIFAISTFNTDYVLVKKENFAKAAKALSNAGYEII